MVLDQQENKSPETVAEWSEWIKRAQEGLAVAAVNFDELRAEGELIALPKAGSGVPVHREEWIEDVAKDIGDTAIALSQVLNGEHLKPHEPLYALPQPVSQSPEESD